MTEAQKLALNVFLTALYGLIVATAALFGDAVGAFVTAAVLPVIRAGVGLWLSFKGRPLPMDEAHGEPE